MPDAAAASSSRCASLASLPCVFVVALGRTGSTHLLRLLNAIPGYRVTGETDNAWIYLGWWHTAAQHTAVGTAGAAASSAATPASIVTDASARRRRALHGGKQQRWEAARSAQSSSPIAAAADAAHDARSSRTLCSMRELMLQLHNPSPRARVFGFKEIYSPFVRDPTATDEVLTHGVAFLRTLFPKARFVFHVRRNLTRAADSDFWKHDWRGADGALLAQPPEHAARFARISQAAARYRAYAREHPDHAFATTLEGLTDSSDASGELAGLFRFLDEPLTTKLKKVAHSHLPLYDWVQCVRGTHARERCVYPADKPVAFAITSLRG